MSTQDTPRRGGSIRDIGRVRRLIHIHISSYLK